MSNLTMTKLRLSTLIENIYEKYIFIFILIDRTYRYIFSILKKIFFNWMQTLNEIFFNWINDIRNLDRVTWYQSQKLPDDDDDEAVAEPIDCEKILDEEDNGV